MSNFLQIHVNRSTEKHFFQKSSLKRVISLRPKKLVISHSKAQFFSENNSKRIDSAYKIHSILTLPELIISDRFNTSFYFLRNSSVANLRISGTSIGKERLEAKTIESPIKKSSKVCKDLKNPEKAVKHTPTIKKFHIQRNIKKKILQTTKKPKKTETINNDCDYLSAW